MPGDPFYQSAAWVTLRRRVLAANPVCTLPGCARRASHVDHIVTRRVAPVRALDETNLQALCHGHHTAKTNRQDGGGGNARRAASTTGAAGCDAEGNPVDPGHVWNRR